MPVGEGKGEGKGMGMLSASGREECALSSVLEVFISFLQEAILLEVSAKVGGC